MILILSGKAKQSIALYRGCDMSADIMKHTAQQMQMNSVSFGNTCVLFVMIPDLLRFV